MINPTGLELDAAVDAMKRCVERYAGSADLVRLMAIAGLTEGNRIRERQAFNAMQPRALKVATSYDEPTTPQRQVEEALKKMESDLTWVGPTGARQAHVVLPRAAAEALYLHLAELTKPEVPE